MTPEMKTSEPFASLQQAERASNCRCATWRRAWATALGIQESARRYAEEARRSEEINVQLTAISTLSRRLRADPSLRRPELLEPWFRKGKNPRDRGSRLASVVYREWYRAAARRRSDRARAGT